MVGVSRGCRSRSCPKRIPGYFIIAGAGAGGRVARVHGEIAQQAEQIILKDPDVMASSRSWDSASAARRRTRGSCSSASSRSSSGPATSTRVQAVLGRVSGPLFGDSRRDRRRLHAAGDPGPEPVRRLRVPGARSERRATSTRSRRRTQAIAAAGNQSPKLRPGLFSPFTANDPQLQVTIDRERALALGLPLSEITSAMQIFLGSQYVNDFEFNNRAYRVYVQADQQFRSNPQALRQLYARTRTGEMVPLEQVVRMKETTAPQVISHFNLFRSAAINGSAAPGVSSGEALKEMERLATRTCPQGMGYAWSGISLEETKAGRQSSLIFGLALLLVYLTLAAQYESLVLPFIVLLGVPLAVLGALSAQWLAGLRQRRLLPGRARHADRPGGEERDPDRRVRRAAAGSRD